MLGKPLIQRHKAVARTALYATAAALAVGVWIGWRSASDAASAELGIDTSWLKVDWEAIEEVRLFRDYLRIDTSSPEGDEIAGAEFLARHLEAAGIPVHLERLGRRNANLWAILEGRDPSALVLHNHIDVEPIVRPERWTSPPFDAAIRPPWIYGRGAFDMKSLAIAQLAAMLDVAASGRPLERSLIFLATGDEETGSALGTRWVLREHPELVARLGTVLTEGGAVEVLEPGEVKYFGVEFGQKRFVDIVLCHADRELLEGVRTDLLEQPPIWARPRLGPAVESFLIAYGPSRSGRQYSRVLERPREILADDRFAPLTRFLRALVRNEIAVSTVEADDAGGYRLEAIVHLLPGVGLDEAWDELLGGRPTLPMAISEPHRSAPVSPLGTAVYRGIVEHVERRLDGVPVGPLFVPWSATDARFFRDHGIESYGFSPFLFVSADSLRSKGPDERMALPEFVEGVELYVELVRELVF